MNQSKERFSKLGNYLKNKRIESDLSQKDVSDYLGYTSPQYVSNWERGLCAPAFDVLSNLCQLYKISQKEMINEVMNATKDHLESYFVKSKKSRRSS